MSTTITSTPAMTDAAAAVAAPTTVASDGSIEVKKEKKLKKKGGAGAGASETKKKAEGKRGQRPKDKRSAAEKYDEVKLLKGISKPATRRLFKQIEAHKSLRLADDTTDQIRAILGSTTRRVVRLMADIVERSKRQTAYLCDVRSAVAQELPRSRVFPTVTPPVA
jgi:hypothetical protein